MSSSDECDFHRNSSTNVTPDTNPKKRLTTHELLCHPWIVENKFSPDKPLDSIVLSRLMQFYVMDKLKKIALRFTYASWIADMGDLNQAM
ncbi:hypothetical protein Tco_1541189 [Tanacetum coccineum]